MWYKKNSGYLNFKGPKHVVIFENLVQNPIREMRNVMKFLGFEVEEEIYECVRSREEGGFKRKKKLLDFEPYSDSMQEAIKQNWRKLNERFDKLLGKEGSE